MSLPEVTRPDVIRRDAAVAPESSRYLNRELSWLDFNARVLALGEDASLPLLERAKFLAIFSSNLDEFFQVRVSGLKEQLAAGVRSTSPDGLDQLEQLRVIRIRVEELVARQAPRRAVPGNGSAVAPCIPRDARRRHRALRRGGRPPRGDGNRASTTHEVRRGCAPGSRQPHDSRRVRAVEP